MTNQEIADFIATEVMKWRKDWSGYALCWWDGEKVVIHVDKYQPATDLNQAAQAAEKVRKTDPNGFWTVGHWQRDSWLGAVLAERVISTIGPADALSRAVVQAAGGEGWELR